MKPKSIITGIVCLFASLVLYGQDVIYGPVESPPEGGVTMQVSGTLGDEEQGRPGGQTIVFSNINLTNYTDVLYATLANEVKMSLNGGDFTGDEILTFDANNSNLATGNLIWNGATSMNTNEGAVIVVSKFLLNFTDLANNPLPLVPAGDYGLDPNIGAVVKLEAGGAFKINFIFLAGESTADTPALDFYYEANTPEEGVYAYLSYDWGWYWVNSAPGISQLATVMVTEGDTGWINQNYLHAWDIESEIEQIKFKIAETEPQLPVNGDLFLNDVAVDPGDTINLSQVLGDELIYVHDDSETDSDSIGLCLFDGDGTYYTEGEDTMFYLYFQINPLDDPPEVTVNAVLELAEDADSTISDSHLTTVDNESGAANNTYTLDPELDGTWPKFGIIKKSDIPLNSGDQFTQEDIDNGLISYKHDGTENSADGFIFRVVDEFGNPALKEDDSELFFFEISVTLLNDPPQFSANNPTEATQWEETLIDPNDLAATDEESSPSGIIFTLDPDSELPQFGVIKNGTTTLGPGDSFTMQNIIDGNIIYSNDGSNETEDRIVVEISDELGAVASDNGHSMFQHMINITLTGDNLDVVPDMKIYPNPGTGLFRIDWRGKEGSYEVINHAGQSMITGYLKELAETTVNLSGYPHGNYLLILKVDGNIVATGKLIKE